MDSLPEALRINLKSSGRFWLLSQQRILPIVEALRLWIDSRLAWSPSARLVAIIDDTNRLLMGEVITYDNYLESMHSVYLDEINRYRRWRDRSLALLQAQAGMSLMHYLPVKIFVPHVQPRNALSSLLLNLADNEVRDVSSMTDNGAHTKKRTIDSLRRTRDIYHWEPYFNPPIVSSKEDRYTAAIALLGPEQYSESLRIVRELFARRSRQVPIIESIPSLRAYVEIGELHQPSPDLPIVPDSVTAWPTTAQYRRRQREQGEARPDMTLIIPGDDNPEIIGVYGTNS